MKTIKPTLKPEEVEVILEGLEQLRSALDESENSHSKEYEIVEKLHDRLCKLAYK